MYTTHTNTIDTTIANATTSPHADTDIAREFDTVDDTHALTDMTTHAPTTTTTTNTNSIRAIATPYTTHNANSSTDTSTDVTTNTTLHAINTIDAHHIIL